MKHRALVVEDEAETAEDLEEILKALDFDSVVVDNKDDTLDELQKTNFCLILLDLQIKGSPDAIKAHPEHGRSLLRKIREQHSEHNGTCFWLPILVVSGFAREVNEAVDVMKDNASYVIQKPFNSQAVSERIRWALEASRRQTHDLCENHPVPHRDNFKEEVVITIPGDRVTRRTTVRLGSQSITLTDSSLRVLLHLIVAKLSGKQVHRRDLGGTNETGFKGVSVLRNELKSVLRDIDIIKSHYHGLYSFQPNVKVGECAVEKLMKIGDHAISALAKQIAGLSAPPKKSDGNSQNFPTQRRRR